MNINLSKKQEEDEPTIRLFVYGIFLDESTRQAYGMTNPKYNTVYNYATFGDGIVEAVYIPRIGLSLTGLTVDMPIRYLNSLDQLEGGYDRELVKTTDGESVYMYVGK